MGPCTCVEAGGGALVGHAAVLCDNLVTEGTEL
jgi:hypothetical protein